ncbi:MAG: C-GCAxxG-C-C family protein [Ruminococcus sp.]|nr:C-GCAxxG-C-C family protein [Ruminococcus sp.]
MNEEKAIKAKEYFMQGYNCSQSVVAAWCGEIGLDIETALKISSCFGGGMGRMREVCGAFSGALMVLGMKYGNTTGRDAKAKGENYAMVQRYAERFKEENGFDSIICRELLGITGVSKPAPAARTQEYYKKRPCPELVAMASGLLGEFMEDNNADK